MKFATGSEMPVGSTDDAKMSGIAIAFVPILAFGTSTDKAIKIKVFPVLAGFRLVGARCI